MAAWLRRIFRPAFITAGVAACASLVLLLHGDAVGGFATMYRITSALNHVAALGLCGLSLALLARPAMRKDERLLSASLILAAWGGITASVYIALTGFRPPVILHAAQVSATIFAVASFIRFTALFPGETDRPRALRKEGRSILRLDVADLALRIGQARSGLWIAAAVVSVLAALVAKGTRPGSIREAVGLLFYIIAFPGALAAGAMNLQSRYRELDIEDRRRVLWVVAGFSTAAACIVGHVVLVLATELLPIINFAPVWNIIELLWAGARFGVLGGLIMATFFSGAFNPRLVIKASTYSAIVGTASVFAAALVDNVISNLVTQAAGTTAAWIAAGVVALLARPVIRKIRERAALSFSRKEGYLPDPNKDRTEPGHNALGQAE